MRLVKASLVDSFNVHKTFIEFLKDSGRKIGDEKEYYKMWIERLTDPSHKYLLVMHSKKVIGMVWGREVKGELSSTFLIEGRFLRRAYKGLRFARHIIHAQKQLVQGYEVVRLICPKRPTKLVGKYQFLGVLVQIN